MFRWIRINPKKSIGLGILIAAALAAARLLYRYKGHIKTLIHLNSTLSNAKNLLGTNQHA